MTAPAEPEDPIAAIAATIQYRRSPSHVDRWQEVSADEFPWFGMAEVTLQKSDEELAAAWRDVPEAAPDDRSVPRNRCPLAGWRRSHGGDYAPHDGGARES